MVFVKRNDRLRGTVVSVWSFLECAVYFWLLDNFFIQELPLYYDAKALVSMILQKFFR